MAISIFDTVSDLKSSSLAADTVAMTLGYYSVNDGGPGLYIIQDSGPPRIMEVSLTFLMVKKQFSQTLT